VKRAVLFTLVLILVFPGVIFARDISLHNAPAQVFFSPHDGTTAAIIKEIASANPKYLSRHTLSLRPRSPRGSCDATRGGSGSKRYLIKAIRRTGTLRQPSLSNSGIPVYIDSDHAIAHNKIMVIDREVVITGSFNFTRAAERRTRKTCS